MKDKALQHCLDNFLDLLQDVAAAAAAGKHTEDVQAQNGKHNCILTTFSDNTPCRHLGQLIGISLSANEPSSKALGLCWPLFILCCMRN